MIRESEISGSRILVVDDQSTVRAVLRTLLESLGFEVDEAASGLKAIERVEQSRYDLVMLDVVMPDVDGLAVLGRIREDFEELELPVIMISVVDAISDVVTALNEGANDYITKPIEYSVLEARVRQLLQLRARSQDLKRQQETLESTIEDRTAELVQANRRLESEIERRRMVEAELKFQAEHDYLTMLHNRRSLESKLFSRLSDPELAAGNLYLCYMDIDQFKLINDTRGHAAGDKLLVDLARLIEDTMDRDAVIARIGGDELAILFACDDTDVALTRAERLVDAVNGHRFEYNEEVISMSASVGLVRIDDSHRNTSGILVAADTACYLAKEAGGNRIKLYQAGDADIKRRSTYLHNLSELTKATEEHRLELWAQPIFPILDLNHCSMVELLLRVRGQFDTDTDTSGFIRSAEHFRYITELDRWVFDQAYRHIHEQAETGYEQYNVNLSGQSISDSRFVDYLSETLSRPGSHPEKFCFEITETAAVRSLTDSSLFVEKLRNLGCSVVLDDFGSGESSLTYLKRLPVNAIKIQGDFIQRITESATDRAIVRSIVNLAGELKIQTVAEFARPGDTIRMLREMGVDFVQGTALAAPTPLEPASVKQSIRM